MTKNKSMNFLLQTLGCFISATGIYSFAVAAEVPVTGIAGICAILYRLFGIPMGLSNVLINIPIILLTFRKLGRDFFLHIFLAFQVQNQASLSAFRKGKRRCLPSLPTICCP